MSKPPTAFAAPQPGDLTAPPAFARYQALALGVGVVATVACGWGALAAPALAARAWLVGSVFWLGIALGCLALLMIYHLTGGSWGAPARRVLEAAARTVPLSAVLMLPLLVRLDLLYEWAVPGAAEHDPLLAHKAPYLDPTAFRLRYVVYFALWTVLALVLGRMSAAQDRGDDPGVMRRMRVVSAPGLVLWAFAVTFAAFDWLMSLQPEWFSTIYGVYYFGGFGLAALSFLVPVMLALARQPATGRYVGRAHFHDYGKLMLAFVLLWSYFAVSQFLITWSGNLPEEIDWYLDRLRHGWGALALALVLFQFVVPFALLLSRDLKRKAGRLAALALGLLVVRWIDLYWNVVPALHPEGLTLSWLDVAAPLAVGGLWLATFFWLLGRRPVLPLADPYLRPAADPVEPAAAPYPQKVASHG